MDQATAQPTVAGGPYVPLPAPPPTRMLTAEQAAAYCGGMSERTFRDFRSRWAVPVIPLMPQTYRYDVRDLDAALDRARVAAVAKGNAPAGAGARAESEAANG